MRENVRFSYRRLTLILSSCVLVVFMVALAGCSLDKSKDTANSNGVTIPVETPETPAYTVVVAKQAFVLGGVDGWGVADDFGCLDFTVSVDDGEPGYLVDVQVQLKWNVSDYPNRVVCWGESGTNVSLSNGVYTLTAYTDAVGVAHFSAAGYFSGTVACSGGETAARFGRVYVEGVEQTQKFVVAAADLNDTSGVDDDDADLVLADVFCGSLYFSRSDYNGDLDVTSQDLSLLQAIINNGESGGTCNE